LNIEERTESKSDDFPISERRELDSAVSQESNERSEMEEGKTDHKGVQTWSREKPQLEIIT
jgi:hypothetical protein